MRPLIPRSARLSPESRRDRSILALALAAAALATAWYRRPPSLSGPPECPGLFELTLPLLLRAWAGLPVGTLLAWAEAGFALIALALFIRLAFDASRSTSAAAGAGLAFAATAAFDRALAPPAAMAVLAAACGAWLMGRRVASAPDASTRTVLMAVGAVAAIPLVTPQTLVPAALPSLWLVARSGRLPLPQAAGMAAALVAGLTLAVLLVAGADPSGGWRLAPGLSCIAPRVSTSGVRDVAQALQEALRSVGPFPFGLAAFGIFSRAGSLREPVVRWIVALAVLPGLWVGWSRDAPPAMVPLQAGFWCMAAVGLADAVRQLSSDRRRVPAVAGRLLAGVALVALLPLLQLQRLALRDAPPSAADAAPDRSVASIWRTLRVMPEVTVIEEDASTGLLLRASSVEQRTGKALRIVPRDRADVANAIGRGRVFAFSGAQLDLQRRGVRFAQPSHGVPGVAEVAGVHPCATPGGAWKEAPELGAAPAFALLSARPSAYGPVTIYLGSQVRLDPATAGWPARALRGFHTQHYDPAVRKDLGDALRAQGIPGTSAVLRAASVTRIILWRTPGASAVLPVRLGRAPDAAVVQADAGAPFLALCPWFEQ